MTEDQKYISTQPHELRDIAKNFKSVKGESMPTAFIHLIHYLMSINSKKVLRSRFYSVLRLMGYKRI